MLRLECKVLIKSEKVVIAYCIYNKQYKQQYSLLDLQQAIQIEFDKLTTR